MCLKQIEKELIQTNGWLKPKLLLEITGEPAAEKLAKEIADKLNQERRMRMIEQYKLSMGIIDKQPDLDEINSSSIRETQNSEGNGETMRNLKRAKTLSH